MSEIIRLIAALLLASASITQGFSQVSKEVYHAMCENDQGQDPECQVRNDYDGKPTTYFPEQPGWAEFDRGWLGPMSTTQGEEKS